MSKKRTRRRQAFETTPSKTPAKKHPSLKKNSDQSAGESGSSHRATRETIESIAIAFILAFLFRAFEAEAFVIPTGSMAPSLMGQHKDLECPQCGCWYRAGASVESPDPGESGDVIVGTTCPMCRYSQELPLRKDRNPKPYYWKHTSFTGDRILVSKFIYEFREPARWDVIVFKYPGNPKQNYIKRLVGLPGETIKIYCGDIYVQPDGDTQFRIARKPPDKQLAMLQRVHDTRYIADELVDTGWSPRWEAWSADDGTAAAPWEILDDGRSFAISAVQDPANDGGQPSATQWLRYRHVLPPLGWTPGDPALRGTNPELLEGRLAARNGQLITDFYPYNAFIGLGQALNTGIIPGQDRIGLHWVGDLGVECDVRVESETGELLLNLIEGGQHHTCTIDLATGKATLQIDGGKVPFNNPDGGEGPAVLEAQTSVQGPGNYFLRFTNVDDQLRLWDGYSLVQFKHASTGESLTGGYPTRDEVIPRYSEDDPGDLLPVGVGSRGASLKVERLQVLRDIYYIARKSSERVLCDFDLVTDHDGFGATELDNNIFSVYRSPEEWATTTLFKDRRQEQFVLKRFPNDPRKDQFFPLGDNSPFSKDGRLWPGGRYVERRLLTGKALFIYWPHSLREPVPFIPNFPRMGFVR